MRTPRAMRVFPVPRTARRITGREAISALLGPWFTPAGTLEVPVMTLAVRLRSAVSLLGRFPALAGVDLDVAEGEIVLVQGANGAGKTTLLRACAGLASFVSGEAEVLGHDLRKDRRAVRRRIGLLGHATFLYDDLTVADNLTFSARSAGADPASAAYAMALWGLDGRLRDVPAGKLSAGQRRRVALASLLSRRPDL